MDYLHSLRINSAALQPDFKKTPFQNQPGIKKVLLITKRMKVEYSQLNIFNPKSGHSPAELDGTGDPDGTPAPVGFQKNVISQPIKFPSQ